MGTNGPLRPHRVCIRVTALRYVDVLGDPHLGYALAFGMIVVTGIGNALYIWMRARAERWVK